jgi:release factor glutamine methyltransferase
VNPAIKNLLKTLSTSFGEGEARATLQLLAEDLLNKNWSRLAAGMEETDEQALKELQTAIQRILGGVPPQHITGKAWFYGRPFSVNEQVLIPRPETEELVAWILSEQQAQAWKGMDIGTGSGCIPITVMAESDRARMIGVDVSEAALEVARLNAKQMDINTPFSHFDILQWKPEDFGNLDVIVSNPPYIPEREAKALAERVRDHEPGLALFVPNNDPLIFYQRISEAAAHWLKPGGKLYFEIHEDYGKEVMALMEGLGFVELVLKKDMQGKDRMVRGRKTGAA